MNKLSIAVLALFLSVLGGCAITGDTPTTASSSDMARTGIVYSPELTDD